MNDQSPGGKDRAPDSRADRYDWDLARGPITAFNDSKTLAEWAKDPRCQVRKETLRNRLAAGWQPQRAITAAKNDTARPDITHQGRTLSLRGWGEQTGIGYRTLHRRMFTLGLAFEDALDRGPEGEVPALQVTAFGTTQALHHWGADERAAVPATTIGRRIAAGWPPENAITSGPGEPITRGRGAPHTAFGLTMTTADWSKAAGIPTELIRQQIDTNNLTMEAALQSLGWAPDRIEQHQAVLDTTLLDLRPGDLVVGVNHNSGSASVTVRRTAPQSGPPSSTHGRGNAARLRNSTTAPGEPGSPATGCSPAPPTRVAAVTALPTTPPQLNPPPGAVAPGSPDMPDTGATATADFTFDGLLFGLADALDQLEAALPKPGSAHMPGRLAELVEQGTALYCAAGQLTGQDIDYGPALEVITTALNAFGTAGAHFARALKHLDDAARSSANTPALAVTPAAAATDLGPAVTDAGLRLREASRVLRADAEALLRAVPPPKTRLFQRSPQPRPAPTAAQAGPSRGGVRR